MREALDESENEAAAQEEVSSDKEGVIKMDFSSKKKSEKAKQTGQGITALKFMQKSEQR